MLGGVGTGEIVPDGGGREVRDRGERGAGAHQARVHPYREGDCQPEFDESRHDRRDDLVVGHHTRDVRRAELQHNTSRGKL